jgi:hypothetical protein
MSVIRRIRRGLCTLLTGWAGYGLCFLLLPGCAPLAASQPSMVAQGKYYSSGEARYDDFFISLYWMQVAMAEAPRVPETERLALARALNLPPQSSGAVIGQRLHEQAQQLSQAGVHLRLDQNPAPDKFAQATVTLRSDALPREGPNAIVLAQVEQSGTNLLRSIDDMAQGEANLAKFEPRAATLAVDADATFADAPIRKLSEVKNNLADARQLLPLMHARAAEVRHASEALLLELTNAVNTDDGTLGPPLSAAGLDVHTDPKAPDPGKKPVVKARPPARPAAAAPAAHPKPAQGDAPAPPPKPSKAAPAPRDFEP